MRKLVLFLALCALPAEAQVCPGATTGDVNYAREVLTVSSTVKILTASVYNPAGIGPRYAAVTLETDSIRTSLNGAPPTAAVGSLIDVAKTYKFFICGQANVQRFQAIRVTTDAAITVEYFQ